MEKIKLKCVTLLDGGAKDWGKHIFTPHGITLCGQPTPDALEHFAILKNDDMKDLISEYKEEAWDITCKKCIEMFDMFKQIKANQPN